MSMTHSDSFDQLMNAFWLRPETAMWREIDIRAMRSFKFSSPSLDLGCGDGLFSFIRAGGCFDWSFDAFSDIGSLDQFFDNVDIFDEPPVDKSLEAAIIELPLYQIDVGFDHNENLLKKASLLSLYRELVNGDANQILPFQSDSFNSLFSNIVYWLDDPYFVLTEIARVLRPGARACLMLPNDNFLECSFYNQFFLKTGDSRWAFLKKLYRGRFVNNVQYVRSTQEWENMFASAGLHVIKRVNHLSKTSIQIWDIGLRPLFPVLHKMAGSIAPVVLIKKKWISIFHQFLMPMIYMDGLTEGVSHSFHCFILEL